jgi:hypothetical protein
MADVHGIQVQGGTFPAQIWHGYMARVLGHERSATFDFSHASWPLLPFRARRSMKHRPRRGG